ncbi:MAG: ABC transporter permease [Gemmataceae bacterium]|nr:ABC transporter permease [Gemmata sp.]MDW8196024.1 ABC transporter permease [Gemmataceae bacterium]
MRATLSLIRREFAAYFLGPIGYVALFSFLVLNGLLFFLVVGLLTEKGPRGVEYPMQVMLGGADDPEWALVAGVLFWGLFPAVTGIITSRLIAEERGIGTLETLLTAPIRDWQVVFAKFTACFGFYLLMWTTTLIYVPILADLHAQWRPVFTPFSVALMVGIAFLLFAKLAFWYELSSGLILFLGLMGLGLAIAGGYLHYTKDEQYFLEVKSGIDFFPVLTSYLGVVLAGAMFLALGLLVSSWVKSQLVAWMLSLLLGLCFVLPAALRWQFDTGSVIDPVVYYISVPEHFRRDFTRGVIDTRPLVLYLSVTFCCLFLTVRSLEARRLR